MNEPARQKEDVLFLLDEFLQLGHMASISSMSRVCRDFQIRLWLIVQDLPGLKLLYEDWESLLGNSGIVQFFGGNENTTNAATVLSANSLPGRDDQKYFLSLTMYTLNWLVNISIRTVKVCNCSSGKRK